MSSFTHPIFDKVQTGDGSPTLRLKDNHRNEIMHHSQGAYTETLTIYGKALQEATRLVSGLATTPSPEAAHSATPNSIKLRVLSLGLGVGYNEMLVACMVGAKLDLLWTFESSTELVDHFVQWLQTSERGQATHSGPQDQWNQLYNEASEKFRCGFTGLQANTIPLQLANLLACGKWQIKGQLDGSSLSSSPPTTDFHCLLYDAFSNRTSPELWTEDFLNLFIQKFAAKTCAFATYAATGALKRALKQNGFEVLKTPGFAGKRESTLAIRS